MSIQIKIHRVHRPFTNHRELVEVMGLTVGDCLKDLIRQFPTIEGALFDEKGNLVNNIEIFVNQESAYPNELGKAVSEGDIIHLTLVIDGG